MFVCACVGGWDWGLLAGGGCGWVVSRLKRLSRVSIQLHQHQNPSHLQRLRQIPVVERGVGHDARREQLVDQIGIELHAGGVDLFCCFSLFFVVFWGGGVVGWIEAWVGGRWVGGGGEKK